MTKKIVKLVFPQHLIKEPLTFEMAKRFNVIPNIRRARVTETIGELVIELEGGEKDLAMGIDYLVKAGVDVRPVEGDVLD